MEDWVFLLIGFGAGLLIGFVPSAWITVHIILKKYEQLVWLQDHQEVVSKEEIQFLKSNLKSGVKRKILQTEDFTEEGMERLNDE